MSTTNPPPPTPIPIIDSTPTSYQFSLPDIISCGLGVVRSKDVPAMNEKEATTVKECYEKYR
jgi:hypothetical protein